MYLSELFLHDVERDIPPVVYFHDQAPERLAAEVSEYIITGGYPPDDPRHKRVPHGIHEAYVRLLAEIERRVRTGSSLELPASWISGFYGSGKSSFAKLLGLSLDGRVLPDGQPLAEAWLARDTSPLSGALRQAWQALTDTLDPLAVVFDIGGQARDNEQIHAAVVRQVQGALGYSPDRLVADYELKLERDGLMDAFEAKAIEVLGRPWSEAKTDGMADDHMSEVLHHLNPDRFQEPLSWVEARAGTAERGVSASEAVRQLGEMLDRHRPDKTLFIVVDEVSQYIFKNQERMLALQSFVSSLGERLGGRVWLLATGQEQLDSQNTESVIGKMKDRFPESLRVHLGALNIRDVVHKRLLQKKVEHAELLRQHFQRHRADLKLFAYECEQITEQDFVDVYPMLPGHIDLLLQITSALRTQVSRAQGDNHNIRGLLQLLGELFRAQGLAQAELGQLITLEHIYAVQHTALAGSAQNAMARVHHWCAEHDDAEALRVAKAVALLQLIADQLATTDALVARCLYDRLDRGDNTSLIREALERLRAASLLTYSTKRGYKLQSGVGQEWDTERDKHSVTLDAIHQLVRAQLEVLVAPNTNPKHQGIPFKIQAWLSDGRSLDDVVFRAWRNEPTFNLDLRLESADPANWVRASAEQRLHDRLLWVVGPMGPVKDTARALARSRYMVDRYEPLQASLSPERRQLLGQERTRMQDLHAQLRRRVEQAFYEGQLYFRGQGQPPSALGSSFTTALLGAAERFLPSLYPHFEPTRVTQGELEQLLREDLSGLNPKFLPGALGIVTVDASGFEFTCDGPVPARLLQYIEASAGTAGSTFFAHFAGPPYGYSPALIRACLLGLLRGQRIRIRPESGPDVTSRKDPGCRDLFTGDRPLRRADLIPAKGKGLGRRDRVAICTFFAEHLGVEVKRDNDAIADAVFQHFPRQNSRLRELQGRLNRLPGHVPTPQALERLGSALERCQRSREIEPTVKAVLASLDALRDGVQLLEVLLSTLTDEAIAHLARIHGLVAHQLPQLDEAGELTEALERHGSALQEQLAAKRPWEASQALEPACTAVEAAYRAAREQRIQAQVGKEEIEREQLRRAKGFDTLTDAQRHRVLDPLGRPSAAMDAAAIAPTLAALTAQGERELAHASKLAWKLLDQFLDPVKPTVQVAVELTNAEVEHISDFDRLTGELRERVLRELERGNKVRLS